MLVTRTDGVAAPHLPRTSSAVRNSRADIIDLTLLGLLQDGDAHGYDLRKGLEELFGARLRLSFGSLYPALARLERSGAVRSVAADARPSSAAGAPVPLTGALTGERAAFRARAESLRLRHHDRRKRRGPDGDPPADADRDRRRKKTYRLTESGRARLRELLLAADVTDDGVFPLLVAFCAALAPEERLGLFRRRRDAIDRQLADRRANPLDGRSDAYRRSLRAHDERALATELVWLDELTATARSDQDRPTIAPQGGISCATSDWP